MLLLASSVKLIAEIALLALVAQGLLALLAGRGRDGNFVYRLFELLTRPFVKATRWITPRVVLDRHVPLVAFLLLVTLWLAATAVKIDLCLEVGIEVCR